MFLSLGLETCLLPTAAVCIYQKKQKMSSFNGAIWSPRPVSVCCVTGQADKVDYFGLDGVTLDCLLCGCGRMPSLWYEDQHAVIEQSKHSNIEK